MPRLLIDTRVLQERLNRSRGLGRYCHTLLCALGEVGPAEAFEYVYLQHRGVPWMRPEYPRAASTLDAIGSVGRRAGLINPFLDRVLASTYRTSPPVDLLHVVEPFAHPPLYVDEATRLVVTVHDLIPLRLHRALLRGSIAARLRGVAVRMGLSTLRRADAIIAVSQHTHDELTRLPGVEPDRVHVVHEAVDPMLQREACKRGDARALLARLGLERERFVLHVGDIGDRKDFPSLLGAFAAARRAVPGLRLAMVGATVTDERLAATRAFWQQADQLGLRQGIVATGLLDTGELVRLYQSALALLFPTRMEGFGLPFLEAMHCGCPVVACRLSVFGELAGAVDWLVAPGDTAAMSAEIIRLAQDPAERARRREHGIQRAARFGLATMGGRTLDVYRAALDGAGAGPAVGWGTAVAL